MHDNNDLDRFDEAFRSWAKRPPRLSGHAAAARVRAAIESPPRRRWIWQPVVTVAAAALVVVALVAVLRDIPKSKGLPHRPEARPGVAVMWLDAQTPLYMNLEPLKIQEGDLS